MDDHYVYVTMEFHVMADDSNKAAERVAVAIQDLSKADCLPHSTWIEVTPK
jgi:hypothetical protein